MRRFREYDSKSLPGDSRFRRAVGKNGLTGLVRKDHDEVAQLLDLDRRVTREVVLDPIPQPPGVRQVLAGNRKEQYGTMQPWLPGGILHVWRRAEGDNNQGQGPGSISRAMLIDEPSCTSHSSLRTSVTGRVPRAR